VVCFDILFQLFLLVLLEKEVFFFLFGFYTLV